MWTRTQLARLLALAVALTAILVLAAQVARAGSATHSDPAVSAVASIFAMRTIEATCYEPGEPNDPYAEGAWGYYSLPDPGRINLAKEMCDGIEAVRAHDVSVPAWERAVGVLVLIHESYHARQWEWSWNEAHVECMAIRHFLVGVRLLGGTAEEADALLPYALAFHYRLGVLFPAYSLPTCRAPWYYPPGGPRGH